GGGASRAIGGLDGDADPVARTDRRRQEGAAVHQAGGARAGRTHHPHLVDPAGWQRGHPAGANHGLAQRGGGNDGDAAADAGPRGRDVSVGRGDHPGDRGRPRLVELVLGGQLGDPERGGHGHAGRGGEDGHAAGDGAAGEGAAGRGRGGGGRGGG